MKYSNPGNREAPFPTSRCSSYRKGSLRITLDYGCQLYLLLVSYPKYLWVMKKQNLKLFHWKDIWRLEGVVGIFLYGHQGSRDKGTATYYAVKFNQVEPNISWKLLQYTLSDRADWTDYRSWVKLLKNCMIFITMNFSLTMAKVYKQPFFN